MLVPRIGDFGSCVRFEDIKFGFRYRFLAFVHVMLTPTCGWLPVYVGI